MSASFQDIYEKAAERKGGSSALESLLSPEHSSHYLSSLTSDRILAHMTKGIFQAGFVWKVIEQKWPGFEDVFLNFNLDKLEHLLPEEWDAFASDKRIIRNPQKIRTVYDNLLFIRALEEKEGKPIATIFDEWPEENLIGLWDLLKTQGSRLGGMTGQYFLRRIGKDSFILSKDVVTGLRVLGLDISDTPTSKKQLSLIQDMFNTLHQQTNRSYTQLSKIMAFSVGDNYETNYIKTETRRHNTL